MIGENKGHLGATAGSLSQTPPRKGWQYSDGTHWHHDPDMECAKPSLQCKSVSVELSGIMLDVQTILWHMRCLGDVSNTHDQSAGRYVVIAGLWNRGREVANINLISMSKLTNTVFL